MLIAYTFLPIDFFSLSFYIHVELGVGLYVQNAQSQCQCQCLCRYFESKSDLESRIKREKDKESTLMIFARLFIDCCLSHFSGGFHRVAICIKEFPAKLEEITQSN